MCALPDTVSVAQIEPTATLTGDGEDGTRRGRGPRLCTRRLLLPTTHTRRPCAHHVHDAGGRHGRASGRAPRPLRSQRRRRRNVGRAPLPSRPPPCRPSAPPRLRDGGTLGIRGRAAVHWRPLGDWDGDEERPRRMHERPCGRLNCRPRRDGLQQSRCPRAVGEARTWLTLAGTPGEMKRRAGRAPRQEHQLARSIRNPSSPPLPRR